MEAAQFPRSDLAHITPDVAAMYARTGPKTLSRDINHLIKLGLLVEVEPKIYQANYETMFRFTAP